MAFLTLDTDALTKLLDESGRPVKNFGVVFLDIIAGIGSDGITKYNQSKASLRLGVSKSFMFRAVHCLADNGFIEILDSPTRSLKLKVRKDLLNGTPAA